MTSETTEKSAMEPTSEKAPKEFHLPKPPYPTWDIDSVKSKMPLDAQKTLQIIHDHQTHGYMIGRELDYLAEWYLNDRLKEEEQTIQAKEKNLRPHEIIDTFEQITKSVQKAIKLLNEIPSGLSFPYFAAVSRLKRQSKLLNEAQQKKTLNKINLMASWFISNHKEISPNKTKIAELEALIEFLNIMGTDIKENRTILNLIFNSYASLDRIFLTEVYGMIFMNLDSKRCNHAIEITRAFYHEALGHPPPINWLKSFFATLKKDFEKIEAYRSPDSFIPEPE
jgi:hypothetical protein